MGIIITSSESCSNEKMPIKCLASSLNQHFVNVSCYDSQFKFLEIGLAFMKVQINPSSLCLYIWPKIIWKPQDDCHDSMVEQHVSWENEQISSLWLKVIALAITSDFCYCQYHWANMDLYEKVGSLWVYSYISQSINKIPNILSSVWWGNKEVDMIGQASSLKFCLTSTYQISHILLCLALTGNI